jgi:electron transfer flavoprotein beta subunit
VKILVPLKRVPDPELKTKIVGGAVDLSNASWVVNPFDEYAVETALRLVENAADESRQGEVVVVSLGPEDVSQQLRSALAMGADRALRVAAQDDAIDSRTVVDTLIALIKAENADLVIMGKQAVDGDSNQVGQMLAARLGWPQATFAASVDLAPDRKSATVGREVDAGVEYKKVPLPAVITVDLRIVAPKAVINHVTPDGHAYQEGPRYASLKGIMKAKKKPMDTKSLGDLGVTAAPVVKRQKVEAPPARPPGQLVDSVQTLVKKLRDEAKAL